MGEFQSGQMGQTVNLLLRLRWFESALSQFFLVQICAGIFFSLPEMGSNLTVKVRYTLGSRKC